MSGGPDSLALLLLARAALPGRVEAATVDHRLRVESADEAAMVAEVCRSLGVPHAVLPVTLPEGNMQDRARSARYAALGAWCARRGLGALVTAHQLDDQAETLVMRLNRGSGLAGLAGVRARGAVPGSELPLIRPLLGWRRSELAEIVGRAGLVPVQDPSNEDERFDRVRVRRGLAETDWLDAALIARSAALLGEAEAYVNERIEQAFAGSVSWHGAEARLTPGPSDYEAVELCARILARFGRGVARSEVAALVERLRRGENASLGRVLARVGPGGSWLFKAEPARREGGPAPREAP